MSKIRRLAGYPRFFLSSTPAWAIGECWLLGLVILAGLSGLAGRIDDSALGNGTLLLCAICGMWAVLRVRVPVGSWWRQVLYECAVGLGLSAVMAGGLTATVSGLGWQDVWRASTLPRGLGPLLLALIGVGYWPTRAAVRLWLVWGRMRRQRMRWALTHAHLILIAIVLGVVQTVFATLALLSSLRIDLGEIEQPSGLWPVLGARLLHTLFPAVGVVVVFVSVGLLAALPFSALFSFLVARKTTRRLERLAKATAALRQGDYAARVEVSGEDEVAQLQADFNAMAGELSATLNDLQVQRDARRALVANVSHELRTPVATMRATIESALEHWDETPLSTLHRDLEVMQGEVLRLQRLIDDLFSLAQVEAIQPVLESAPTDVGPLIQRMVDAVAPLAWQSGQVQMLAELPYALPWVLVDPARLEQVLANLLRNAVRHTPPGGIVVVAGVVETECVRIEVRDTGEGISTEDLSHIWERFYRGRDVAAREGEVRGAGLGLALVKELTEAMGGTVAVESAVGEGSCFTVRVPKT